MRCPRYRRQRLPRSRKAPGDVAPWRARLVVLLARYGPRRGPNDYYGGGGRR